MYIFIFSFNFSVNSLFRIGQFYPNLTSDFDMADCPEFWKSTKIQINVLNMGEEDYMDNIEISAYIAVGLDILVGIGGFLIVWKYSKMREVYNDSELVNDELGPWSLFGCNVGRKRGPEYSGGPNGTLRLFALLSLPMSGLPGDDVETLVRGFPNYRDVKRNISVSPVGPFKLFRGFGKLKFVCFKIILAFGVPALDTIMGKEKL